MIALRPHLITRRRNIVPAAPAQLEKPDDAALAASVRSSLKSTGYQQLLRIDVAVESGHVRLSGRVGRYYLRQIAQQAALTTQGVATIDSRFKLTAENATAALT